MLSSNGCACGVEEISARRMEWKGVEDREGATSHSVLDGLLIISPTRSLKVMTMSLPADGCMGGTIHYTSIHTGSCHDSRIDMSHSADQIIHFLVLSVDSLRLSFSSISFL